MSKSRSTPYCQTVRINEQEGYVVSSALSSSMTKCTRCIHTILHSSIAVIPVQVIDLHPISRHTTQIPPPRSEASGGIWFRSHRRRSVLLVGGELTITRVALTTHNNTPHSTCLVVQFGLRHLLFVRSGRRHHVPLLLDRITTSLVVTSLERRLVLIMR